MKKSKKISISGKTISLILGVIFISLIIFLLINLKIITNPLELLNHKTEKIEVKDLCSIIGGKLIHSIEDEGDCQNICFAECDSNKKLPKDYQFEYGQNSCNKCSCYCK